MNKLQLLQILRAVAAIMVVFDHSLTILIKHPYAEYPLRDFAWFLGEQGVVIFFVISGFIMITTSWDVFQKRRAGFYFLKNRLFRIIPMYWIFTSLAVLLTGFGLWNQPKVISVETVIKSFLLIPYLEAGSYAGPIRPILGPGWTLMYELFFYIIFAIGISFKKFYGIFFINFIILLLLFVFNSVQEGFVSYDLIVFLVTRFRFYFWSVFFLVVFISLI
ncbi:acyltransferase family protein [Sphaerotilus hippei]|nr:acyltransferase [Sphaerotilus hippei]